MKKFFWISLLCFFLPSLAQAGRATPFQGRYEILSQKNQAAQKQCFYLIADTLGNIWAEFGGGKPFPPDLEKYRHAPSILTGFNIRKFSILTLEQSSLISDKFIILNGNGTDRLELVRRADGNFDLGTRQNQQVAVYLLGPPQDRRTNCR